MSAEIVCLTCRRRGACEAHGIVDAGVLASWLEAAPIAEQDELLRAIDRRARRRLGTSDESAPIVGRIVPGRDVHLKINGERVGVTRASFRYGDARIDVGSSVRDDTND